MHEWKNKVSSKCRMKMKKLKIFKAAINGIQNTRKIDTMTNDAYNQLSEKDNEHIENFKKTQKISFEKLNIKYN